MAGSHEPIAGESGDAFDGLIGALANKRRRYVLHRIATATGPVSLSDLVDGLAAWERRTDGERIEASLLHNHLPRMEAADLIEVDPADRSVSMTAKGRLVDEERSACTKRYAEECG